MRGADEGGSGDSREKIMTEKPVSESVAPLAKNPEKLRPLSDAAQRALTEADARRAAAQTGATDKATEVGGRGGLDPARYGDWEVKGVASDF